MSSTWPMVPLGEVLIHHKEFIEINDLEPYKRCRVQLHAQGVVLRDQVPGAEIKTKKQQVCRAGDFLVAEIDAKLGGYGIVPSDLKESIVSSHYFLFGVDEDKLDRSFLGYFIRTSAFFEQVAAQGSTNYAAIRPSHVLDYTIPLPPLFEQRRLVDRIDALAAKIEEAKGLREIIKIEQAALSTSGVSGILEGLEYSGTLGDCLLGKPRNGWSARCDGLETGTAVLSLGAATGFWYRSDRFKWTSESTSEGAHYWLKKGDLLISRSNTPELVGHAAIYNGHPSPCIYPDLLMRLDVDQTSFEPRFVHYVLQSRIVRDFIKANAKGTSPTMKKISQGIVMAIPFPSACPRNQQMDIVEKLETVRTRLQDVQKRQNDATMELNAMLPAILDRAFRGDL